MIRKKKCSRAYAGEQAGRLAISTKAPQQVRHASDVFRRRSAREALVASPVGSEHKAGGELHVAPLARTEPAREHAEELVRWRPPVARRAHHQIHVATAFLETHVQLTREERKIERQLPKRLRVERHAHGAQLYLPHAARHHQLERLFQSKLGIHYVYLCSYSFILINSTIDMVPKSSAE